MFDENAAANLAEKFKKGTFVVEKDIRDYFEFAKGLFENDSDIPEEFRENEAVFQLTLTDINFNAWIEVKDGKINYKYPAVHPNPTSTLLFKKKAFEDVIFGRLNASVAYMSGQINIRGPMSKAVLLRKFIYYIKSKLDEFY